MARGSTSLALDSQKQRILLGLRCLLHRWLWSTRLLGYWMEPDTYWKANLLLLVLWMILEPLSPSACCLPASDPGPGFQLLMLAFLFFFSYLENYASLS